MIRPCWSYSASTLVSPCAEPQAGRLFPGGGEPDRFGQPGVAEGVGEQGHAAAVFHRLQLLGVPGQDHLGAGGGGLGDRRRPGPGWRSSRPRRSGPGCRAGARPGRGRRGGRAGGPGTGRCCTTPGTPAARVLRADWDGVMPITRPSPAAAHARPPRPAPRSSRTRPDRRQTATSPRGAALRDTGVPGRIRFVAAAGCGLRSCSARGAYLVVSFLIGRRALFRRRRLILRAGRAGGSGDGAGCGRAAEAACAGRGAGGGRRGGRGEPGRGWPGAGRWV